MTSVSELRLRQDKMMRTQGIHVLKKLIEGFVEVEDSTRSLETFSYVSGYKSGRLYGWDQYFEGIIQIHLGWEPDFIRGSLKIFLESQDHTGFIPRTLPRVWWGDFHAQPFLAQQAMLLLRAGDDFSWFYPKYFYALKAYLLYWLIDLDKRGEGLSVWDHAGHSGMDNHYERAGYFHDSFCEGVDLNAYLVRECEAFSILAEFFDQISEAESFKDRAEQRREAINKFCWNETDGIYYDYHAYKKQQIKIKYIGAFATLWAKVPDASRASRLVTEHLLNENEFLRSRPYPALAATESGYKEGWLKDEESNCCSWRAHTWMPTNYYTFQGLRYYGFDQEAAYTAIGSRNMFSQNPFREYYASETGSGCGLNPFWGWSGLALFMEEELKRDIDMTKLKVL